MELLIQVVGLFAVVVLMLELARRWGLQAPVLLLATGIAFSFVPGMPSFQVDPQLVLLVALPLLLYGAAFTSSLPEFRANLRPIGLLSIGLTLFTTVVVGFVLHAAVPGIPLAPAMVLGAIVAPPDAVAAVAIGRGVGMPRRVVAILEGESLFNDAAALTAYKVAIGAVVSGSIGFFDAAGQFALALAGGLVIGLVAAVVLAWVRTRLDSPMSDTALSLIAPFVAYLPAEAIDGSGIVSVVVVGLYLGHRAPSLTNAPSRLIARSVWQVVDYLLSGVVFVLIGLQMHGIVNRLDAYSPGLVIIACVAVVGTLVVTRIVWIFPNAYLPPLLSKRLRQKEGTIPWQEPAIAAWAGLRGVVSLSAAFALPLTVSSGAGFPQRDLLLFLTFVAIVATLFGQGLSLPLVVRTLRPPTRAGATDHAEQELRAHHATADAELDRLDELLAVEEPPEEIADRLGERAERRRLLAETSDGEDSDQESASAAYRRLRQEMLAEAKMRLVGLRDSGEVDEEVFRRVQRELDLEETILRKE